MVPIAYVTISFINYLWSLYIKDYKIYEIRVLKQMIYPKKFIKWTSIENHRCEVWL